MIAACYGKEFSQEMVRDRAFLYKEGAALAGIGSLAESLGFRSLAVKLDYNRLVGKAPMPCIVSWNQNHYVVVYKATARKVWVADPAYGLLTYSKEEFIKGYAQATSDTGAPAGLALLLEPTPELLEHEDQSQKEANKASFGYLFKYLMQYRKHVIQLLIALFLGGGLQLLLPFLTRSVVDIGIGTRDVNLIYLILGAQLLLYATAMSMEFLRGWILMHVNSRINVFLISDFLIKLMKLPVRFFDSKVIGDLIQRINDHKRVEQFMTDTMLRSVFSAFSILILVTALFIFHPGIFAVFIVGTLLELGWIFYYMNRLKVIDRKSFALMSEDQGKLIELINGMQEIRLNNIEKKKRWEWERIQASLFKERLNKLKIDQFQAGGQQFINYVIRLMVILVASLAVINGQMTIGTMLAVIFILGELDGPIGDLINFVLNGQMAKLSLERMGEIHLKEDEESLGDKYLASLPEKHGISLTNVSFSYTDREQDSVLSNVNLIIPQGKVTAIVGVSGSGKTTLLKLLLKFYEPLKGKIQIGGHDFNSFGAAAWRNKVGTVMQESYIFSDTIAGNIALQNEEPDEERLIHAAQVANIHDFFTSLPLGYNTKIGQEGMGLSAGQRQRLLIARAVYKAPEILFFDEATNALDANNELVIMRNLDKFFKGRTVVVVAHRLSTVKNADQIIVVDEGEIVEFGSHDNLVGNRDKYYQLIKNQLELGN